MAKRANYGFVKRQKELQKKQRKDEKAEKKRLKADAAGGDQPVDTGDNSEHAGTAEDSPPED